MWLFTYNHTCSGYIQITTLNNKNTFGAPYKIAFFNRSRDLILTEKKPQNLTLRPCEYIGKVNML